MSLPEPRWAARLPTGFVVACTTLGPLGRKLPAPGTWGSAAGLLYAQIFFRGMRWEQVVVWTLIATYLAAALCGEAERRLGRRDPGMIVLDEFVVMPLVFLGWRAGALSSWPVWAVLGAGFALFRVFDILKPFGIARLQRWPGGWGVVADDFAAALAACATLHLVGWLAQLW